MSVIWFNGYVIVYVFFKVLRYCKGGSPLWVSAEHVPRDEEVPECQCGAKRLFEFQVM